MPSPNQTENEMDHIFIKLFELDLEDEKDSNEEDSIFMTVLNDIASKHGIDAIALFPEKIFAAHV